MRRYKKDVYAIPYEGEEVKLHWANADQYYIKTSEFFKNYRFKTESGKSVIFTLVEASTEQNNNKAQGDKERKFKIYTPSASSIEQGKPAHTVEEKDNELHVYFIYEPMDKGVKQDTLITEAFEAIRDAIPSEYSECLSLSSTEKDKTRTLIQKHINDYVKRNTFDYFIHKDLYGFLTRELDFYIKNEILYIDDIDTRSPESFIASLAMIKAVKQIGEKVITFLSSLEEFQKKLFLKKKMVVETGYCITLDRIDPKYYLDISTNKAQIDEWISLFAIDVLDGFSRPLSREFLESNPFLVLDTKHFDESWKNKLIGEISESHNLDEWLDGLMINSENFQALNLLQERYREQVKCIYIDPPYNTNASEIVYKNEYKHSSWLSLIENRIMLSRELLKKSGIFEIAIDNVEFYRLEGVVRYVFGDNNHITNIAIMNNPKGRDQKHFADCHEYTIISAKDSGSATTNFLTLSAEDMMKKFKKVNGDERYRELPLRRSGSGAQREDRPYMFFPFLLNKKTNTLSVIELNDYESLYNGSKFNDEYFNVISQKYDSTEFTIIYPVREDGSFGRWRWGYETCIKGITEGVIFAKGNTIYQLDSADDSYLPKTLWSGERHDSSSKGTNLVKNIFGTGSLFDYPKSIETVQDFLLIAEDFQSTTLDFFAGSGTTGHAVINLNREDAKDGGDIGKRKYILVEMGEYFDTVTKPRIQKVIYSEDWKGGKPVSRKGSSHAFKYLRLESYEDVLNNLKLQRSEAQQGVLFAPENTAFRESYMLGYMLDTESRGSILSIDYFAHPFDFEMDITRNNETTRTRVDLVETFNYLIGLVVEHSYEARGYRVVKGRTLDGERILIVWRDFDKHSNEDLNNFLQKSTYNPLDTEFDRIYINGDNSVENMKTGEQTWKVILIEEEFKKRMFEI